MVYRPNILDVAAGGTGVATVAADTLLQGGTTVTASNTLSNNFTATTSTASSTRSITASNSDNTSGTSNASFVVYTGGASGGDPYISATITAIQGYSWGVDNSDSDALKETNSNAGPSNGSALRVMQSTGEQTMPLQSAFLVFGANGTNVTGDGTNISPITFSTEIFDQNSDFASNTYTAPVTARVQLNAQISWTQVNAATQLYIGITTSNRSYQLEVDPTATAFAGTGNYAQGFSVLADMDAADTAIVYGGVSGITKTVDITGAFTYFSGFIAC